MTLSSILEFILGIIFFYYILSLIVSSIVTKIAEWMDIRANIVEDMLRDLLADGQASSELLERFKNHPLITSLTPRTTRWQARKMMQSIQGHTDEAPYKMAKIPTDSFVLALFNALAPEDEAEAPLASLRAAVARLPAGNTHDTLGGLIAGAGDEIQQARQQVALWVDQSMANVSRLYRIHTRRIVFVIAALVIIVLDADSVAVAQRLWQEPTLRAAAAAKADAAVSSEGVDMDTKELVGQLEELDLPLFWQRGGQEWGDYILGRLLGWLLTWFAVALGSSFWYDLLKQIRGSNSAPAAG